MVSIYNVTRIGARGGLLLLTTHGDGTANWLDIVFLNKNLACLMVMLMRDPSSASTYVLIYLVAQLFNIGFW